VENCQTFDEALDLRSHPQPAPHCENDDFLIAHSNWSTSYPRTPLHCESHGNSLQSIGSFECFVQSLHSVGVASQVFNVLLLKHWQGPSLYALQICHFNTVQVHVMASTSAPLADYFWIAGIDSLSYSDPVFSPSNPREKTSNGAGPPSPQVDETIEEGSEGETPVSLPSGTPRATARHSRNNSWNRLSKLSNDVLTSIHGLDELEKTQSNRSSITIKGPTTNGNEGGALGDFDFDKALLKFASERENFLDDLSFSAGAPVQKPPPPPHPRTDRLKLEDVENNGVGLKRNPLRSVGGSIRRRISFRDMNSMKRQPSMVQRTSELVLIMEPCSESIMFLGRSFLEALWLRPRHLANANSFCPNFETTEQLQLSNSAA